MNGKARYIPAALILLVLWAPFLGGETTHRGIVVSRLIVLALVIIAFWRMAGKGGIMIPRHWTTASLALLALLLVINTIRAVYGYIAFQWLIN